MSHVGRSAGDSKTAAAHASTDKNAVNNDFPVYPGVDCLSHVASAWEEAADAKLVKLGLYEVAYGGPPSEAKAIFDEHFLPNGPVGTTSYDQRTAIHNSKVLANNTRNEERRFDLLMEARTKVYGLIKASVDASSMLLGKDQGQM